MVKIQYSLIALALVVVLVITGCGWYYVHPLSYFLFREDMPQVQILKFDEVPTAESYDFLWSHPDEPYLKRLRAEYELDKIVAGSNSDYEKIQAICLWVHGLWKHHGFNEPQKSDPISILQEVKQGKRFRCVEYAIVINGCLNALGIPSRVLGLKTEDVESRRYGAGHVVIEAYLQDINKWILIDGQWYVIPLLNGTPLNAVELQNAIAQKLPGLNILSLSETKPDEYFRWIGPYLFYFDIRRDNRVGVSDRSRKKLMLVPIGANKPKVFQQKWPIGDVIYTHSVYAFYTIPE